MLCRILVLAALLSPRDFGLYGMAMLTMLALNTLSATNFESALIHKTEEITPYLEVAWTVRTVRGLALAVLFFGIAPGAAAFFDEPAAMPLMRVLRGLENTKLPFIVFSYCKRGGSAYEDIDFGSEWDITRTGGLGFAFG